MEQQQNAQQAQGGKPRSSLNIKELFDEMKTAVLQGLKPDEIVLFTQPIEAHNRIDDETHAVLLDAIERFELVRLFTSDGAQIARDIIGPSADWFNKHYSNGESWCISQIFETIFNSNAGRFAFMLPKEALVRARKLVDGSNTPVAPTNIETN